MTFVMPDQCNTGYVYVSAQVAFFGCGDALSYGSNFCDALGEIYEEFAKTKATLIGALPMHTYTWAFRKEALNLSLGAQAKSPSRTGSNATPRKQSWTARTLASRVTRSTAGKALRV